MGRAKVPRGDAKAIAARLREFAQTREGSWEGFYKKLNISRTTAGSWIHAARPCVPDPSSLLVLARKANINLNWLLLGEGPELRVDSAGPSPREQLEEIVKAELRQREDASPEEFDAAWTLMMLRPDLTQHEQRDLVLRLAVDAVAVRFAEALRYARTYHGLTRLLNTLPAILEHEGAGAAAAQIRGVFKQLGLPILDMEVQEANA